MGRADLQRAGMLFEFSDRDKRLRATISAGRPQHPDRRGKLTVKNAGRSVARRSRQQPQTINET